jgi:hypothetical protein
MDKSRTTPSGATRAEEDRDAQVKAGADEQHSSDTERAPEAVDADVIEHEEEMARRGSEQQGEGRLP